MGKAKRDPEAEWWRRRFPTVAARAAGDAAADALPVTATMAAHIDAWIAAYRATGGVEPS